MTTKANLNQPQQPGGRRVPDDKNRAVLNDPRNSSQSEPARGALARWNGTTTEGNTHGRKR